jgi:hypothetical protein
MGSGLAILVYVRSILMLPSRIRRNCLTNILVKSSHAVYVQRIDTDIWDRSTS